MHTRQYNPRVSIVSWFDLNSDWSVDGGLLSVLYTLSFPLRVTDTLDTEPIYKIGTSEKIAMQRKTDRF